MQPLPIDPLLPSLVASLRARPTLVLEAPPGAGKTTRVPRALFDAGFAERGEIVVLEPRRLAARMAARRVAQELGEKVGERVGYRVRFEDVSSPRTRIRFVTEGVMGRMLLDSPALEGISAVVLDEFHERHLHGDVALALTEALRRTRRPDLLLLAMSATLDVAPLAAHLGAPVLRSEGTAYEVAIEHLPAPDDRPLAMQVASAVRKLVAEGIEGDVLVFLPGSAEIRRASEACAKVAELADLALVPLHGDLSPHEQDAAVRPGTRRKVILSTNVAESSITVEGVRAVVDSGLARVSSQTPWSGMPRVRVQKVSKASATQRSGRSGRTGPGRCLRLYTRADFDARADQEVPEIRRLDLAQTWLELKTLGARELPWLEPPPASHAQAAEELLQRLGATDGHGDITEMGRAMVRFPVHPRAARVIVEGLRRGAAEDACIAAALLTEGDNRSTSRAHFGERRQHDRATERSDIDALLDLYREAEDARFSPGLLRAAGLDPNATGAVARTASRLLGTAHRMANGRTETLPAGASSLAMALLAGHPDRVARRVRPGSRQIAFAGGGSAELSEASVVRDAEWMVALDAEEREGGAARRGGIVVHLASAIEPDWLIELFPERIEERRESFWDEGGERAEAREAMLWGHLVMHASETRPGAADAERLLAQAAVAAGPSAFAPEGALERWLARTRFAASLDGSTVAPSDEEVRATLVGLCAGRRSFAELREAGLLEVLRSRQISAVDRIAPERVALAGGRTVPVKYEADRPPSISSRLQDFFGMTHGPRVGVGKIPLLLELLAPNGRAVQVTTDLAGFWSRHYPVIRKELMRRYPRHSWPDDPTLPTPRMRPRT